MNNPQAKNTRLPAFTLMELMVGMVVSLIVGSAAFMGYLLLFRQFEMYRLESVQTEKMAELSALLREDIYKAEWMEKKDDTLLLLVNKRSCLYSWDEEKIVRETNWRKDTFEIRLLEYHMSWKMNPLFQNGKIDRLSLTFEMNEQQFPVVFYKNYAADVLMKLEKE